MNKVKFLLTYRYSEIIHDLTVEFTRGFLLGHLSTLSNLSNLSNLSDLGDLKERPVLPATPQDAANFLLTLCHQVTFLLDRQIKALEEKFVKEGGYTENLFKKRLQNR